MSVLRVENAVVRFDGRAAVDDVDLTVGDGETLAILGPSGCGKTTLLRAIAGLQTLDAGTIRWDGDDVGGVPPHERNFGFMFQEYALFPHRNVGGNVEFGLRMHGLDRATRSARVDEVLDLVGLAGFQDRAVATLSGGEQQRVALARALAVNPRLLMLDEPLGALDREWRARLVDEIRTLLDRAGLAAIYVTHDHAEAFAVANRVVVMRSGRVVQAGSARDVWARPATPWVAEFLGLGASVAGEVRAGVLRVPWGEWVAPEGAPDGAVEIVVRPDALRLDTHGRISAVVTRARFAGARVEITAQPDAGPPLVVSVDARDAPVEGARITIACDARAVLLYPPN
jgi:thiamine transport system ATP-binding protein